MNRVIYALAILMSGHGFSQSIEGTWKTIDDESGEPRSVVEIYEQEGRYNGKIVQLFRDPGEEQNPMCEECEDDRQGQPIIGMEIISDMKYNKGSEMYQKGEILDPENGNIYDCKIWIDEDGNLKVRGYLLFFYRTQTWLPYSGE